MPIAAVVAARLNQVFFFKRVLDLLAGGHVAELARSLLGAADPRHAAARFAVSGERVGA